MTRLWIVRAGRHGERESEALANSKLLPGFDDVGDLGMLKDRTAIIAKVQTDVRGVGEKAARNYGAQLNQFVNTIQIGDLVVLPRKLTSGVSIGRIKGNYHFVADGSSPHVRDVEWIKDVPRSVFSQDLLYSFGAFMTICEVQRNEAVKRVKAVIATGADPGPLLGTQGTASAKPVDDVGAEEAPIDIEDLSSQQIVALIKSSFAGHALADLVGEILRVEGYLTKVSKPGPDGGVDILAAGGRLGLGEDRVCVQVKSGDGPADSDVVIKLMGSVQMTKAKTGLLVSIGGVNAAAQKHLESDFFTLRLWQMRDLLDALFRSYPRLSEETRARLPLKQVWAPAAIAES